MKPQSFAYSPSPAFSNKLPFLPITLTSQTNSVVVSALVDSGSTINVLPYQVGLELGLIWEAQTFPMPSLVGILQNSPSYGILLMGQVASFAPVTLAFAWTQNNDVPIILGQTNFFEAFEVCFLGFEEIFTITPKNFVSD